MAPSTTTQDYYNTLGVDQNAPLELITRAYRRLALKLHPDRGGSTQAFQLLGLAYETLNGENKRRAYDQIFPSIGRTRANPQRNSGMQTPRPAPAPTPQSEIRRDDEQLAALREDAWFCNLSGVPGCLELLTEVSRLSRADVSEMPAQLATKGSS